MAINLGKILKTSEKDYFNLTEENSSDYVSLKLIAHASKPLPLKAYFARKVPNGTEVVVNYKEEENSLYFVSATGIALFPKPKKPEKSQMEINLGKIYSNIPIEAKRNMKKNPDYYRKEEVHFLGHISDPEFDSLLKAFAENVPDEAEFVINYGESKSPDNKGMQAFAKGTALIPKDAKKSGTGTGFAP